MRRHVAPVASSWATRASSDLARKRVGRVTPASAWRPPVITPASHSRSEFHRQLSFPSPIPSIARGGIAPPECSSLSVRRWPKTTSSTGISSGGTRRGAMLRSAPDAGFRRHFQRGSFQPGGGDQHHYQHGSYQHRDGGQQSSARRAGAATGGMLRTAVVYFLTATGLVVWSVQLGELGIAYFFPERLVLAE